MSATTLQHNMDTFLLGGDHQGMPLLNLAKHLDRVGDSMETQHMNILLITPNEADYAMIRQLLAEIEGQTPFTSWSFNL